MLSLPGIKQSFKNAVLVTLLCLAILGPILSLVLEGFDFHFVSQRLYWLIVIIFLGRFCFGLIKNNVTYQKWMRLHHASNAPGVIVAKGHGQQYWQWAFFIIGCILPFILDNYWLSVAILTFIYILLGLGLNIVVGLAGLLDLGFVAFYAVGAYGFALGAEYWHLGFWTALPFSALLAALFGALLGFPVLRLQGDYLAIVTLGFGEIIRLILNNWVAFTGGPNGVDVPSPTFFGLAFTHTSKQGNPLFHEFFGLAYDPSYRYLFIYLCLFLTVLLLLRFVSRLQTLPLGRAWEALREDEIASRSLGINHVTTKLSAFSLGAMSGGIGGVFFAAFSGFINPASFTFMESALILAIVVLGGMGSIKGVIVAACVFTLLPEFFREFAEYRLLIFGAIMVLLMIWRPGGLMRTVRSTIAPPEG